MVGNSNDVCLKLHSLFYHTHEDIDDFTHCLSVSLSPSPSLYDSGYKFVCVCTARCGYICHFPFSTTLNLVPFQFIYYTLSFLLFIQDIPSHRVLIHSYVPWTFYVEQYHGFAYNVSHEAKQ